MLREVVQRQQITNNIHRSTVHLKRMLFCLAGTKTCAPFKLNLNQMHHLNILLQKPFH